MWASQGVELCREKIANAALSLRLTLQLKLMFEVQWDDIESLGRKLIQLECLGVI